MEEETGLRDGLVRSQCSHWVVIAPQEDNGKLKHFKRWIKFVLSWNVKQCQQCLILKQAKGGIGGGQSPNSSTSSQLKSMVRCSMLSLLTAAKSES